MGRGFSCFESTVRNGPLAGKTYEVRYRVTGGPPVILLHELLGPSPSNVRLADFLASRDRPFSVYLPIMFGRFNQRSYSGLLRSKICLRREFVLLRTGRSSPIVTWIRQLVGEVSERHHGDRVGLIGMCLTGGFVFGLIADPRIGAGVASQPSLPLSILRGLHPRIRRDLGTTPSELPDLTGAHAEVTMLRYSDDWMCPPQRVETAQKRFGSLEEPVRDGEDPHIAVASGERLRLIEVDGRRHSVLTADLNRRARDLVADYLDVALATDDRGVRG